MTVSSAPRGRRWSVAGIRRWPLWSLSPLARAYVIVAVLVAASAAATAGWYTAWHPSQLPVYLLLLACAAAMVEATRDVKLGRDTMTRDLQEVWYLAIALLLPPIYAFLCPIPLTALKQWRVRRNLMHRRVFSIASNGLAYGAASVEFHQRPAAADRRPASPATRTASACCSRSWPPPFPAGWSTTGRSSGRSSSPAPLARSGR